MARSIDVNITNAADSEESSSRLLITLYLDSGDVYFLQGETLDTIQFDNKTFITSQIGVSDIIRSNTEEIQSMSVALPNIERIWSVLVTAEGDKLTGRKVLVQRVYLDGNNNIIANKSVIEFYGEIYQYSETNKVFSVELETVVGGYSITAPIMTYQPTCQWMQFKDVRCGYAGLDTTCNRTIEDCISKGNELNFGGILTMPKEMVVK